MIDSRLRSARCRLIGLEDDKGARPPIGETVIVVDRIVPRVVFVGGDCFVLFANLGRGGAIELVYAQERPFYADLNFKPERKP